MPFICPDRHAGELYRYVLELEKNSAKLNKNGLLNNAGRKQIY